METLCKIFVSRSQKSYCIFYDFTDLAKSNSLDWQTRIQVYISKQMVHYLACFSYFPPSSSICFWCALQSSYSSSSRVGVASYSLFRYHYTFFLSATKEQDYLFSVTYFLVFLILLPSKLKPTTLVQWITICKCSYIDLCTPFIIFVEKKMSVKADSDTDATSSRNSQLYR